MAVIALGIGIWLARGDHDGSRTFVAVAATTVLFVEADPTGGSALLARLLPWNSGVRGRADRARAHNRAASATGSPTYRSGSTAPTPRSSRGTRSHTQAPALRDLWLPLSNELSELESTGQDVIVDAGRLGLVGSQKPLLAQADLTLVVTRTNLPALSAVRSWVDSVQRGTFVWRQAGVVVIVTVSRTAPARWSGP